MDIYLGNLGRNGMSLNSQALSMTPRQLKVLLSRQDEIT